MKRTESLQIDNYLLKLTSSACPEQYDVFDIQKNQNQIAYLRLRHGFFYAAVPQCGGEKVYSARPQGDGMFRDEERMHFLTEAVNAIKAYYYATK